MLSCLFHSALCVLQILCTKTSVIFRSLYLDVIVCCSVQDKGYLWRWEERDRAAEPMGLLPEPDSVTSGLRKKGLFIISSHSYFHFSFHSQVLMKSVILPGSLPPGRMVSEGVPGRV